MKKRYNDGGLPDYEREPDEQDRKQQEGAMAEYTDRKEKEAIMAKPLAKASFKEAFAEARDEGKKQFEWNGKMYSTEMAKSEKSFSEKAKKAGFSSAETKGGAALMTRKDRSENKPAAKAPAKKADVDYSVGNAMRGGGKVSSASKRADGCAIRGKTRA